MTTVTASVGFRGFLPWTRPRLESVMEAFEDDLTRLRTLCNASAIGVFLELDTFREATRTEVAPAQEGLGEEVTQEVPGAEVSGSLVLASTPASSQSEEQATMALEADLWALLSHDLADTLVARLVWETLDPGALL